MDLTAIKPLVDFLAAAAIILSAIAGIAAAVFISAQVRNMQRSRELDAFLRVVDAGNQAPVRQATEWLKHDMASGLTYEAAQANKETWLKISTAVHHFEMLGVLVSRRYLSKDLIYDQMGPWIGGSWAKLKNVIGSHRSAKDMPEYAENFELLARGLQEWARDNPPKLEKRQRAPEKAIDGYYKK